MICKSGGKSLTVLEMCLVDLIWSNGCMFTSLLKLFSDNSEIHMKIGKLYIEQGDLNKALRHTETALKLDQHFMVALLNKADIHCKVRFKNSLTRIVLSDFKMQTVSCIVRIWHFSMHLC